MLNSGQIQFAIVEGLFNKSDYEYKLLKTSRFILTAAISHPLAKKEVVSLEDIIEETIIVREEGSGSREVLEKGLFDRNYTLKAFKNIIEIGNVNVIKEVIKSGLGIGFMYEDAACDAIRRAELVEIEVVNFNIEREFNYIYLKNNINQKELNAFFHFFKNRIMQNDIKSIL
jgi:DNA-binding transcriptional LysR family regulator